MMLTTALLPDLALSYYLMPCGYQKMTSYETSFSLQNCSTPKTQEHRAFIVQHGTDTYIEVIIK